MTTRCLHRGTTSAALLFAAGCAVTAQRPPTPAADPNLPVPTASVPGVRHYLILFGSESLPRQPRLSHTWATVARVTEQPGGTRLIETDTISWLPANLDIRLLRLHPEPGVNLGLHETLIHVLGNGERITQYGPFEIRPRFYHRFLVQKQFVESGAVGYQAVDTVGGARDGSGSACIHAITDMDPDFDRANYPLIFYGSGAARRIVRQIFQRGLVVSPEVHCWLNEPLGLCPYPIRHRAYHGRLGPYRGDNGAAPACPEACR